ncbi:MAG TPA: hypothetical protein VMW75_08715 [Thermoanaerobaculia bacterium]|nr:hypothetical protein [Thermoanaerobaculia bacterium]
MNPAAAMAFRAAPAAAMTFRAAPAHRAVLARVLAASRVERRPEPPDASYLRDLVARLYVALAHLFERASGRLGLPWWLLPGIAAVLAVTAAALLARAWRARRRRAAASGPDAAAPDAAATGERRAGESDAWGAAAWRLDLDRRLAQRQVPEALRATWWWLARSLAGARAEPTWTGRELLRLAGREDLAGLVRELDAMTYGPRQPVPEEVRGLAARLEATLA